MDTSNDFREHLVTAVAFRMVETWNESDPKRNRPDAEEARRMVRHVVRYGTGSPSWAPVSKAATDLFKPILGVLFPVLSQVTSAVVQAVQAENQRGQDAEAAIREDIIREVTDPIERPHSPGPDDWSVYSPGPDERSVF